MASDPILHIKDSYYFDVPRKLYRASYDSPQQIADQVGQWAVRNDADYQSWEADQFIDKLSKLVADKDALSHAKQAWLDWQHADGHANDRWHFQFYNSGHGQFGMHRFAGLLSDDQQRIAVLSVA